MNHFQSGRHETERNKAELWGLLALIVYAPLPLASDRPWALALLGFLAGCLLLWTVWRTDGSVVTALKNARIPLLLQGLWLLLIAMQLFPLQETWLMWLNKNPLNVFDVQAGGNISIDPYSTRLYLAKACILSAVFWLTVLLVNSSRRIKLLASVIVFSGLMQALVGVMLMATGATYQLFFTPMVDRHAHGTFVYHNHFAGYLELTLATGIGLMIAKLDGRGADSWRKRLHGWLALLLSEKAVLRLSLIIMVVGLVASRSRMGNSAFFASLLITGLLTVIITKYMSRKLSDMHVRDTMRSMMLFIMSLVVIDVVIIGGVVGVEKVVQRIQNTNMETQVAQENARGQMLHVLSPEESVEQRSKAARSSIQIVREYPLFGTGGGTYHLSFPHYRPAGVQGYYDHAHNDYVEFASETGLSGLLLMMLLVMHSLFRSIKLLIYSRDQLVLGMAFASLMGVTSLLIHASVDFNFQSPANAMLFMIMLSLPYMQKNNKRINLAAQKKLC